MTPPRQRVAVVGSGLAGLTAAYLLVREGADVWLIDRAPRLGFHAWSVELDALTSKAAKRRSLGAPPAPSLRRRRRNSAPSPAAEGDKSVAVDVPMRSFQGGYYPLLIALYKHLGLPLQAMKFTFSFAHLPTSVRGGVPRAGKEETYFVYAGSSGASRPSVPSTAWSSPLAFVRALLSLLATGLCYVVLLATAFANWHGLLPSRLAQATFGELVDSISNTLERPHRCLPMTPLGEVFRTFAAQIVLPLFSAVGTMTSSDVWTTPAGALLNYIHLGLGTDHYTLGGGRSARDVAALLSAPVKAQGGERVRLGTAIRALRYRSKNGKEEIVLSLDGADDIVVDRVILATPASAAGALLGTLEPTLASHGAEGEARRVRRMRSALAEVEYRDTIVVTHRDERVLPYHKDVRDINLFQPREPPRVQGETTTPEDVPELTPTASAASSPPSSPCPTPSTLPPQLGSTPYFSPSTGDIYTMATHIIQPPGHAAVFQTTNPVVPIDPEQTLGVARLERALPLKNSAILDDLHPPADLPRVLLAGSYAYPGIPLLEGCVGSARRAVEQIYHLERAGGVDWDAGRGGVLGRAWRWRRG